MACEQLSAFWKTVSTEKGTSVCSHFTDSVFKTLTYNTTLARSVGLWRGHYAAGSKLAVSFFAPVASLAVLQMDWWQLLCRVAFPSNFSC
jgi:hypothetical protein